MEAVFSECPLSGILVRGTVEEPALWRTPKWANKTYRKRSIDTAIEKTTNVYTPRQLPVSDQELYRLRRRQIHGQK